MASLSNINGIFDVHSTGAVLFSTSHGAVGQVLKSNGNAAPTWVDVPPIIDDRYVLVAGDTMTGNLSISGTNTLGVGGNITALSGLFIYGTSYWVVSTTDAALQRVDARDDATNFSRLHWYGENDAGATSNFRHAYYDGSSYINVTADSGTLTYTGKITATNFSSTTSTANIFLGSVITKPGDNLGFIVRNSSNAIIGSLLRTSNTTTELTADTLDLGGTTAQYVRGDGSFATYSPGTGNVTGSGAANRVTYWSSGTNVTSDAGFTYNGAGRVNTDESFGVSKDGADTVADGPFFRLTNAAQDRQYLNQLDASNNIDYWYYNGTAWTQTISLSTDGGATFAGAVNVQGDDKSLIVRNAAGTVIGTMGAESSSTPNVGMTTVRNNGTTTIQFNSNGSSYINGGNLGIGTGSPNFKLHVSGTGGADTLLRLENTTTNKYPNLRFTAAGAEYDIGVGGTGTATGYVHNFYVYDITNSAPRITLTQAGNVGIGTQSPSNKLEVAGNINVIAPNPYIWIGESGSGGGAGFIGWNDASNFLYLGHSYGSAFNKNLVINDSGNVGIGTTAPGYPLDISKGTEIQARFVGSQTGHVQGAIVLSSGTADSPGARGQGVYRFNEGNDTTWYTGTAYQSADKYIWARKASTTSLDSSTAQTTYALMTLDNAGKLGIGTASPSVPLHVARASTGTTFRIQQTASNLYAEMQFSTPTGNMYIFVNSSGYSSYGGANSTNFYTSNGAFAFHSNVGNNHLYIGNNGNVGIGTTSPDSLLVVQADAHNEAFAGKRSANDFLWFLRNENNSGRFQLFDSSSSQTIEMTGANGRINQAQMIAGTAFALSNGGYATLGSTSSSVPIAIAIDGDASTASIVVPTTKNVCIGGVYNYTGTGVTSLNINASDYPLLAFYGGSTLRTTIIGYSNNTLFTHPLSSAKWQFENGTGMMGELSGAGNLTVKGDVVAYGSPSDISLKENIKPIKNPLGKIKKLKGVTFNWKKSESILDIKEDYGFIAQDVKKVIPELVRKNENELLSMRHQGVIPILVEAIKELEARVKELENK